MVQAENSFVSSFILRLIVLSLFIAYLLVFVGAPGDGTVVDSVKKVGVSGFIWKTHYVELTHDTENHGRNTAYAIDDNDTETIRQLEKYSQNKTMVKITYHTYIHVWPWQYASRTVITDIEEIDKY